MIYNSKEDGTLIETEAVLDRLSDAITNGVDWLLDRQDAVGIEFLYGSPMDSGNAFPGHRR
jgi:hypothetical protein